MARIELDAREQRAHEYSSRFIKWPVVYVGVCAGCGKRLPAGYVPIVEKWESAPLSNNSRVWDGSTKVLQPRVQYCRECGREQAAHVKTYRAPRQETSSKDLSVKDIAIKAFEQVVRKPRSARRVAVKAGIEYTQVVKTVLDALAKAGKIKKTESGRYYK